MSAFYNLFSLVLGFLSWLLGGAALFGKNRIPLLSFASFTCCGASLVSQFFEVRHRILTGDLSAILDIYPAMAWITLILLAGTVLLNASALLAHRPK